MHMSICKQDDLKSVQILDIHLTFNESKINLDNEKNKTCKNWSLIN